MPTDYKGIPNLYDKVLDLFSDKYAPSSFYEWIDTKCAASLQRGQVCCSVIYYFKRKRWYLDECAYNDMEEEKSTWYARELFSRLPSPTQSSYVKKYFDLSKDESIITAHCKTRPIILIDKICSDWWAPDTKGNSVEAWMCMPLFSYKPRHSQSYVLRDQSLKTDRFYAPQRYIDSMPGLDLESAFFFDALQTVQKSNIMPLKCYSLANKISLPYKISDLGMKLLMYHMYKQNNILSDLDKFENEYIVFKSIVGEQIDRVSSI